VAGFSSHSAFAQSTWNGSGTDWSTTTDWTPNTIPTNAIVAQFNSAFTNQPTLSAASNAQGIYVTGATGTTGNAGTTTISGPFGLTIAGTATINTIANAGILLDLAGNNNLTIASSVTGLTNTASTSYLVTNGGTLTINAPMTITAGTTLTLGSTLAAGTGSIVINGNIAATSGGIKVANTAGTTSVTLAGSNSFSGATTLSAGTLNLTNTGAITNSALTVGGTAGVLNLRSDSSATFADASTHLLTGGTINVDQLTVAGTPGSTITLGSSGTICNASSGTFTFTNGHNYNLNLGALTNGGNTNTYTNSMTNGTLTLSSFSYTATDIGRTMTFNGSSSSGVTAITGNITQAAPYSSAALSVTESGSGTLQLGGTTDNYTGPTKATSGTIQLLSNTGLGFGGYSGGTAATAAANNAAISAGATLDLNGQTNVNKQISIAGTGVGGNGALINSAAGTTAVINNGIFWTSVLSNTGTGTGGLSTAPTVTFRETLI
jgi:hypothetical protein